MVGCGIACFTFLPYAEVFADIIVSVNSTSSFGEMKGFYLYKHGGSFCSMTTGKNGRYEWIW